MNNPYTYAEVVEVIRETIHDILGIDKYEIRADSSIVGDLGVESLDFLDLTYQLERRLGISLPRKSVLDHASAMVDKGELISADGRMTERAVYLLTHSFNRFEPDQVAPGMFPTQVFVSATVANWAKLCHRLLDFLPVACPGCGHAIAGRSPQGLPACAGCHQLLKTTSGDECVKEHVVSVTAAWATAAPVTGVPAF